MSSNGRSLMVAVAVAGLLAGCGPAQVEESEASDGLDCTSDTRVGWAIDRGGPAAGLDSPEAAVHADVDTDGGRLLVGERRDNGDVVAVDVIVERDGRADMRVEVWSTDSGWLADNVEACG